MALLLLLLVLPRAPGVRADIIPADFFPDVETGFPAFYQSELVLGPRVLVDLNDVQVELYEDSRSSSDDNNVVVNGALVVDVLIFRARRGHDKDYCVGEYFPESTFPQCMSTDTLLHHGIGVAPDKDNAGDEDDDVDDDGPPYKYLGCCTDTLVTQGKCQQTKTLILNECDGLHYQWSCNGPVKLHHHK